MNAKKRVQLLISQKSGVKNVSALERQLNLANGTIAHWYVQTPGTNNLIKVADYFGCSLDYLTERSDNPGIFRNINESAYNYDLDTLLACYTDRYGLTSKQTENIQSVVLTYLNADKRF